MHVTSKARAARLARLGGALAVAFLAASGARAAEPREERFEKTYEISGIRKVRLQNVNGGVSIETGGENLKVVAVKSLRHGSDSDLLRETEIRVTKTGSSIEIETILPKRGHLFPWFLFGRSNSADVAYQLTLPASVAVEAETVNGRIGASKRTGDLVLSTVNGAVKVEGQDGPLKVNTVNGSVEVSFLNAMRQSNLETVNGSVTITCAKDSSIRCSLQTTNGRIQSEFPGHDRGQVGAEGGPRLDQRRQGEPRGRDRERRRPALRRGLVGGPAVGPPSALRTRRRASQGRGGRRGRIGALGQTRTGTDCSTRPSNVRVYQFRHQGTLARGRGILTDLYFVAGAAGAAAGCRRRDGAAGNTSRAPAPRGRRPSRARPSSRPSRARSRGAAPRGAKSRPRGPRRRRRTTS